MSKERKARILTFTVLAAALGVVLGQRAGWKWPVPRPSALLPQAAPRSEPTPQDAVYGMLDAARTGDVNAYLNCYTGQMEASLKQSLAETGPDRFSRYLKETNASIKGIAIAEPQTLTESEVRLRVEYVYQDRNEAQILYLIKTPGGWRIARADGSERVKTLIPYGTPVQ